MVQTQQVFTNVSKGQLSKKEDLQKAFGTDDMEKCCLMVLILCLQQVFSICQGGQRSWKSWKKDILKNWLEKLEKVCLFFERRLEKQEKHYRNMNV